MNLFYRIILLGILLIVAGLLFSFAGPEEEWGSIQLIGIISLAIFIPWEMLFIGKRKSKQKNL